MVLQTAREITTAYTVEIDNPNLEAIGLFANPDSLEIALAVNDFGWVSLLAAVDKVDPDLLVADNLLQVFRYLHPGGRPQRIATAFLRRWTEEVSPTGQELIKFEGPGLSWITTSRIIAYKSGSAQATKTNISIGDMMLQAMRENLGSDVTDAARDLSGVISIPDNLGMGATGYKAFSFDKLYETLIELGNLSRQLDITKELYFYVTQEREDLLVFHLAEGYPGNDRRQELVFALENQNLKNPKRITDFTKEITTAYVAGPGEAADRIVREVSDSKRESRSIWSRREALVDARNLDPLDPDLLDLMDGAGYAAIAAGRPRITISAELLSVPGSIYGVDWDLGDAVTANVLGQSYDGIVDKVKINVNRAGKETIIGNFRVEEEITA